MASIFSGSQTFLQSKSLDLLKNGPHGRSGSPQLMTVVRKAIKCEKAAQWISTPQKDSNSDVKAFDASMVGVKGLVDSGVKKIPSFFHHENLKTEKRRTNMSKKLEVPLIDLMVDGASDNANTRAKIVSQISKACEEWGFFQIVNHGIPLDVMKEMIRSTIAFHEQDHEIKKQYYSRDSSRRVIYTSNFFMYNTTAATWKDTFLCKMAPVDPNWDELPEIFRDVMNEYAKNLTRVGHTLFELLSEALGLEKGYLLNMGCAEGLYCKGHYSPPCPEPELTLSSVTHTDFGFLTLLMQNEVEGLQVLHDNEYVDVPYVPGALVINIGDIFQIVSNNKFKSVYHRALARDIGPRVNVASFLRPCHGEGYASRIFEPIKELLSADNPPVYRPVTIDEYIAYYGLDRCGKTESNNNGCRNDPDDFFRFRLFSHQLSTYFNHPPPPLVVTGHIKAALVATAPAYVRRTTIVSGGVKAAMVAIAKKKKKQFAFSAAERDDHHVDGIITVELFQHELLVGMARHQ